MYIKVHKLPLFRPNINLSNNEVLFISDHDGNYVFDGHIVMSGSDFIYDRKYTPFLIIERFGDIELHHHFIQEPDKNKKFPPLKWIHSEWASNKYGSILSIPNICKIRGEVDLEHSYLNLFETACRFYLTNDIPIHDNINRHVFVSKEADKFALADVQLNELKKKYPFTRSGNYTPINGVKLIDSIYDQINDEKSVQVDNDIIITNAFKSMPKRPDISIVLKYLRSKDKSELSSTDLNNILRMFDDKDLLTSRDSGDVNTITEKDLSVPYSTIMVSNITNVLSSINSLNFTLRFSRDKNTGEYVISSISSINDSSESDSTKSILDTIKSSDLPKYITTLSRAFRFSNDVKTVEVHKSNGIINIMFELESGEKKELTFNMVSSVISTSALCSDQ